MPWLTIGGWAGTALFFFMYLGLRDDLASEVEQCNTDKITAVAEAERITRETLEQAHSDALAELARQADRAERARQIAEEAARLAEARPPRVVEVIRESNDACLDTVIPADITDSLRHD